MKKIIYTAALLFTFSLSVNAQDVAKKATQETVKKQSAEELAKKDATDLAALVGLNETQTQDFYRLFVMKYQTLQVDNLSLDRKSILKQSIEAKIRASLNSTQMTTLEKNSKLFDRLKA